MPRAVSRAFLEADRDRATALLARDYPLTRERGRIGLALVFLSGGSAAELERHIAMLPDWRDILVAAENTKANAARFFAWIEELDASNG